MKGLTNKMVATIDSPVLDIGRSNSWMWAGAQSKRKRLEEVVAKIDLALVKYKLTGNRRGLSWTQEYASVIEQKYRNFLVLVASNPGFPAVPSHDVDEFWHMHILFTKKYAEDCDRVFGRFIHHTPYVGGNDKVIELNRRKTWELYQNLFGEEIEADGSHRGICSQATCDA